jgi:hypothetical protein
MDYNIAIGLGGWAFLIVAAFAFGVLVQLVGRAEFGYEWIATALGAMMGAVILSEFVVGWRTWEPVIDGIAALPAVIGGLVLGLVVAVIVRVSSGLSAGQLDRRPATA